MVLRHKKCLLYTRVAFKYGCYCGVNPGKCPDGEKEVKDCLDSCCKFHAQCFKGLRNNCTGLEPYKWEWQEKVNDVAWVGVARGAWREGAKHTWAKGGEERGGSGPPSA